MSGVQRSYGGRSAEERTAERRERLVTAAIEVLAARGAGATMTAICSAAGLTERYFYESFANTDDALLAALDAVADEIAALAVDALENTPGSPEERVHTMARAFVELVVRSPAKGRVAVIESNALPHLRTRRHELVGTFADLVAREARALYGDQAWPADRARVNGIVYIAGMAELVAGWLNHDVALTPEDLVTAAGELFGTMARRGWVSASSPLGGP